MSNYCDDMYCSQDYGFELLEGEGSLWCKTCGRLEATKEDLEEWTEEELREVGLSTE